MSWKGAHELGVTSSTSMGVWASAGRLVLLLSTVFLLLNKLPISVKEIASNICVEIGELDVSSAQVS